MGNSPKISIIIPTLNSSATFSSALESILQQWFTDFEVLIIDGLSVDNTIEIARNCNDNRIKIYRGKDNGIYDAMNKGILLAKGEWLYFLGSDDRLFDNKVLSNINKVIVEYNSDIIYGDVYSTRFNGRYGGEYSFFRILNQNICHQSIFFKKTVFEKTGLFKLKYKSHADWDHNLFWFVSESISKIYKNLIIAEYADGGYSSLNYDRLFEKEKVLNYLCYGKRQITISRRIVLLFNEIIKDLKCLDIQTLFKLIINTPKIIIGV